MTAHGYGDNLGTPTQLGALEKPFRTAGNSFGCSFRIGNVSKKGGRYNKMPIRRVGRTVPVTAEFLGVAANPPKRPQQELGSVIEKMS